MELHDLIEIHQNYNEQNNLCSLIFRYVHIPKYMSTVCKICRNVLTSYVSIMHICLT